MTESPTFRRLGHVGIEYCDGYVILTIDTPGLDAVRAYIEHDAWERIIGGAIERGYGKTET